MSQRNSALLLNVSQPHLCKNLKSRLYIGTLAPANQNTDRKTARSGKNSQVESTSKNLFSNFRENITWKRVYDMSIKRNVC
jgi:hypothetical protein